PIGIRRRPVSSGDGWDRCAILPSSVCADAGMACDGLRSTSFGSDEQPAKTARARRPETRPKRRRRIVNIARGFPAAATISRGPSYHLRTLCRADEGYAMNKLLTIAAACVALLGNAAYAGLDVGDKAPDFKTDASLGGNVFKFSMADALKKGPVVLYFFP